MSTTPITAPARSAVTVEIFEPEQEPGQGERIIDTFDLDAGETREYDIRSATAAYRFITRGDRYKGDLARTEPAPDQEAIHGDINPYTPDEMEAGKARTREYELAEDGETARLENQRAEEEAARAEAEASTKQPPKPKPSE